MHRTKIFLFFYFLFRFTRILFLRYSNFNCCPNKRNWMEMSGIPSSGHLHFNSTTSFRFATHLDSESVQRRFTTTIHMDTCAPPLFMMLNFTGLDAAMLLDVAMSGQVARYSELVWIIIEDGLWPTLQAPGIFCLTGWRLQGDRTNTFIHWIFFYLSSYFFIVVYIFAQLNCHGNHVRYPPINTMNFDLF